MAGHVEDWQRVEAMFECLMPELHLSLMLAMSRMGLVLVLLLVTSLLLYLAIKGIRTGKVGTRRSGYTEQESF